ncbi:hypothetical protein PUNSTDRAFT_49027 [Punctularia strigosozonata HHB-11173 SS5]|uniref:uncharacterized protein n=1 Tax=Punctularia strigosozonata (strain HHB-11173) TaxID=741275 RepID=UPI0004416B23|nr:uncharacterized protein PUNSTDRAFT_49027 [Punctularia strigosozonata HHB-11173 SS5]EIN14202.1 hypothetical protein PUNSTDRAFT_49027 [Punctularia strigosozonata HHB-11173 SS5]
MVAQPNDAPLAFANNPQSYGNFDLVKRIKLTFTDVEISKWRSRKTGLSVVHIDYDAPIVNGYFVVATEIFDDTGCPHTLEHLVFMGSQKYPYKGIIDHLANRGFSNGTNAWTDTDHTAYTVSTAGDQGFLQLLPIYVDHILYPTMTDAGFVTEVHHINPKGEDSGVVYSEMQGRQNTAGDLMSHLNQQLVNPVGSAYRSETGGLMEALRRLTIDQIRQYHGSYYLPHNLSLIVTGKLSGGTAGLLKKIQNEVEPNIVAHGQDHGLRPDNWKRPFLETASAARTPFQETVSRTIEFPEKDESVGELIISFMGPPPNAFLERKALDILGTYLTSSAVAPLNKEYVEIENPFCTYIYFSEDVRATLVDLPIYIGSVPTEYLDTFDQQLKESLRRIVDEGIDMPRMAMVINRDERQLRSRLESSKGDTFSMTIINDFLYGPEDASELESSLDEFTQLQALRQWTSKEWTDILQKYYIDPHCVVVRGKPSAKLADKLEKDEKIRVAEQVKELGEAGLAAAAAKLEAAKSEHDRPIPSDILTSFPVPNVKSISWIPVQSLQEAGKGRETRRTPVPNEELTKHVHAHGSPLPFFVQYDHVKSDFVTVHALFSLEKLPNHLRLYVSTYLSSFFSLPVRRASGEYLTHEQVINQLDDETVSYEVSLGMSNQFTELLRISLKVEVGMYDAAVAWLKDLLYGSEFTKERLQVAVAKIRQSLPELKRDGNTVLGSVSAAMLYDENSTSRAGGVLTQMEFIPTLSEQLESHTNKVLEAFEQIRSYVTAPAGVRFSVTGNVLGIDNPRSSWQKYFADRLPESSLDAVPTASDTLSSLGKNPSRKAEVLSLPTIESSYVCHTSIGMRGFTDVRYPALRIALEVLNATESYLWRYIRGSGLAYGAYVSNDHEAGLLSFSLYRSSNPIQGFHEAAKVVRGLVDGTIAFDETALDAAKSSIVYGITKNVSTAGRAATVSFINQALKGVPQDYYVGLLDQLQTTTKEQVLATLKEYFLPLFDPSSSVASIVTGPGSADEIAESLTSLGFEVKQRTLEVDPEEIGDGSESDSDSESSNTSSSEQ